MEAVLFIGIPASGKSTFYHERFQASHVRINLDMLKTRRREAILLQACLQARQSFVVDNTNVLARERAHYIALVKPAGFQVIGYFFQSRLADALRRNQQRTGKACIPERGIRAKFRLLELPRYEEGFDRLYHVSIDPDGQFQVSDWVESPNP